MAISSFVLDQNAEFDKMAISSFVLDQNAELIRWRYLALC